MLVGLAAPCAFFFFGLQPLATYRGFRSTVLAFCPSSSAEALDSLGAEVDAVLEQALLATLHFEDELGDRRVGNVFEGGPHAAALGRVDAAGEDDVDLPAQVGDEVGQLVGRAAQVDRAFDRVVEQRRDRPGEAVDRGGGALAGRRTGPGCRPF